MKNPERYQSIPKITLYHFVSTASPNSVNSLPLFPDAESAKCKDSDTGAVFSDCRRYRYRLWRFWDSSLPRICFVLLNPSTADEIENDPTVERQVRRVKQWGGFGGVEIVNAYAFRSTNPEILYDVIDPVGSSNDDWIISAASWAHSSGGFVVCGWGKHAAAILDRSGKPPRHRQLLKLFTEHKIPISAFGLNADGTPRHPLYISYDSEPFRWEASA